MLVVVGLGGTTQEDLDNAWNREWNLDWRFDQKFDQKIDWRFDRPFDWEFDWVLVARPLTYLHRPTPLDRLHHSPTLPPQLPLPHYPSLPHSPCLPHFPSLPHPPPPLPLLLACDTHLPT